MGENSKIEWTDHTFNPWIGCTKVSPGCKNCYAETQNKLYNWTGGGWGPGAPRKITSLANWNQLRKWDRASKAAGVMRRVFVASLADFLDDDGPRDQRQRFYLEADVCSNLQFLILTKRAHNYEAFMPDRWLRSWPANVKPGFTAEDQTRLEERLAHVARLRARHPSVPMFFVSYEPALGPLDLVLSRAFEHVDWVICGGESGSAARPMHPDWARDVRVECQVAGVPFFFKQWGEWFPARQMRVDQEFHRCSAHSLVSYDGTFHAVAGRDRPDPEFGLYTYQLDGNDGAAAVYKVGKKDAGSFLDNSQWKMFPKDGK